MKTHRQTSHPPNAARLGTTLAALRQLGFPADAGAISGCWSGLCQAAGCAPAEMFGYCLPEPLLAATAARAIEATAAAGCRLAAPGTAAPIAGTLNEAWTVIWDEGSDFPAWERQARSYLGA